MKKFFLTTAAVLVSSSAYAADYAVVHPFYTPAKGKFVSTTSFDYMKGSARDKAWNAKFRGSSKTVSEAVEYGVTDDVQIGVSVSRDWSREKIKDPFLTTSTHMNTNTWGINAGYNIINDGKAFLNIGLQYRQSTAKSSALFGGTDMNGKFVDLKVSGGYNFDAVTVFGSIGYDRQVDGEKEKLGVKDEKDSVYSLEAGVFKAFNDRISASTSLSVDIDETKNSKERTYWWNVGADYSFSKDMALGLNAGYMLDNDKNDNNWPEMHHAYKLGVDFTIEF